MPITKLLCGHVSLAMAAVATGPYEILFVIGAATDLEWYLVVNLATDTEDLAVATLSACTAVAVAHAAHGRFNA
jgi:hypothetical protein